MVKKYQGFTLLELLIVIGLIGILVAVATTSYGTIQKKSRDGRRMSDMKAIQNAFEQYYADMQGTYPKSVNDITATGTYVPGGMPTDPKNTDTYVYTVTYDALNGATYCACALLEGGSGGNATDATCTFGAGSYYCVKNLQ